MTWEYGDGMTERTHELWQDDEWRNDRKLVSSYDDDGDLEQELQQQWFGDEWLAKWKYTYTDEADHVLLSRTSQIDVDGVWMEVLKKDFVHESGK